MTAPKALFIELKIASKDRYVCEIVEKLYNHKQTITVYTENKQDASKLNDLLWTWKQESFIPHAHIEDQSNSETRVLLTSDANKLPATESIILHHPLSTEKLEKYGLVIDFAEVYHSGKKKESRERYKKLRDSGKFEVDFLQLGAFLSK